MEFPLFKARASSAHTLLVESRSVSPKKKYIDTVDKISALKSRIATLKNTSSKSYQEASSKLNELEALLPSIESLRDEISLSKTALRTVRTFYAERMGVSKPIQNKYLKKGILNEAESIELAAGFLGWKGYHRITERKQDDFFTGIGDVENANSIDDIKNSWSFDTFPYWEEDLPDPQYKTQGQVYMHLYKKPLASVVYTLTDAPDCIVESEARRIAREMGIMFISDDDYTDFYMDVKKTLTFSHLPIEMRVKQFIFEKDDLVIEELIDRVEDARKYAEKHIKPIYTAWQQSLLME